ncbi:helix-hairpin-helix domain-containing protein [Chitinimonas naiadis]
MNMTRTVRALCLAVLAMVGLSAQSAGQTMRVHFIDVGQGAATLVEFPCAAMLIDTGGERNPEFNGTDELMHYLDTFFALRPDLHNTLHSLVLTHPHSDHTQGVQAVISKYKVLNALTNGLETGSGRLGQIALQRKVAEAEETPTPDDDIGYQAIWQRDIPKDTGLTNAVIDPISCTDIDPRITALWGQVDHSLDWTTKQLGNGNNHSVAIRVDFGKASLLIAGDLEDTAMPSMIAHYQGSKLLDVDVMTVNHHGSHNGTTDAWLRATTPDYAVIEMGSPERQRPWTAWAYGHPRKDAVERLQRLVAASRPETNVSVASKVKTFVPFKLTRAIYGTGWDGTVILEADTDGRWRPFDEVHGPALLNLNTATVDELIKLPMIGHVRAAAIVQYRNDNGPFQSVDDLSKIQKIKAGTISALRHLVTTGN